MPSKRESKATQSNDSSTRTTAISRRSVLSGIGGIAVLGTAGCLNVLSGGGSSDSAGTGDWRTYRGNHQRTGRAPADVGPGDSLSVAWETSIVDLLEHREDVTARRLNEDVSRGDLVIAGRIGDVTLTDELALCSAFYRHWEVGSDGSNDWGGVVALDADSGSIEWTITGIADRFQTPTVGDGRLYQSVRYPLGTDVDGPHVLVADATTGEVEARHPVAGSRSSGQTITAEAIYHLAPSDADGNLVRIDTDSGEREWITGAPVPDERVQPFTVADGSILYGATVEETQTLLALDPETGEEQWRQSLGASRLPSFAATALLGAPSVVDGRAYVAGSWRAFESGEPGGTALRSVSLGDRSDRWQFRPEPVSFEELDMVAAMRCQEDSGCSLPDGHSALRGTPLVLDDLVVVPGVGQSAPDGQAHARFRHLYAVSADDGSLQWSIPGRAASAVAAGDVVYARMIGDRQVDDRLVAISKGGSILDSVSTAAGPSRSRSPSIGHGRVYTTWGFGGNNVPGPDTVAAIE